MSGDKNKPNPHAAEHQEANEQNGAIDGIADITSTVNPFSSAPVRGFHFGKTSFEGYDLNEMIDIVESASPELLENAATALVDARDAIKEAADELKTNLGEVDWEGEAHSAFYKWGQSLVTTAHDLAGYADVVGTQILAAGSGLASVRKSMPSRDNRSERKTIDDIPEAKRVESNDEYAAALKAEKNRQEAINQMYRLASFYAVSQGTMTKAEEPVFPKMPDVGVPAPSPGYEPPGESPILVRDRLAPPVPPGPSQQSGSALTDQPRQDGVLPPQRNVVEAAGLPDRPVGTEIDSVGTLPSQEAMKPTTSPSSTSGPVPVSPQEVPPLGPTAARPSARGPVGRGPLFGGSSWNRPPVTAQGRVEGVSGGTPAGRTGPLPTAPGVRATPPGHASGHPAAPVGRAVGGGMPRPLGTTVGRPSGTPRGPLAGTGPMPLVNGMNPGGGRGGDGVVGGRPVTASGPAAGGSRLSRGVVVGSQAPSTPGGRAERPGNRAVVGAPTAATTTGLGGSSSGGTVIGAPRRDRDSRVTAGPRDERQGRGPAGDRLTSED